MKLDQKELSRFEALWRHHLRFPGMVSARALRALRSRHSESVTAADIQVVYNERVKLGVRTEPFSDTSGGQ